MWGPGPEPVALQLAQGTVGSGADFDDFGFEGLTVRQPELRRTVTGFLEVAGRRIDWDRTGHRDHSWGHRNWGVPHIKHHADYHPDMTQRRLEADLVDITGQSTHLVLDVYGVIKLPTHDPMGTVIYEAACTAQVDGAPGAGQFGTHWPGRYLQHLVDRATPDPEPA